MYYLIRPQQQRLRNREAEGLGGLEFPRDRRRAGYFYCSRWNS
jgi:hypothetical protein